MSLSGGDVVHLRVGIVNMGDGKPPWLPGDDELRDAEEVFKAVVPKGVKVIATHAGIESSVLCSYPEVVPDLPPPPIRRY